MPDPLINKHVTKTCRFCGSKDLESFLDLGATPLCEEFLTEHQLDEPETSYPLHARICRDCLLIQLHHQVTPETIFREYAYFSSYSDSWLDHASSFCQQMQTRFDLWANKTVCEIASNDGYLLQNFSDSDLNVYGVEPAINVAQTAIEKGIETITEFFGESLALDLVRNGKAADLLIANNVLAHVPDLNDFVRGLKTLLADKGVLSIEFPHVFNLIEEVQFDTIYHEHFCYFSFMTVQKILRSHGLRVFDVSKMETHGGSLRVLATHEADGTHVESPRVANQLDEEVAAGMDDVDGYSSYRQLVENVKLDLVEFLLRAKRQNRRVAGYGAPGKGNTLLNYCGIGPDLIEFTVDRNPYKHGRFLPGSRIPICDVEKLKTEKPDIILILPWNLKTEIVGCLEFANQWDAEFWVPIPFIQRVYSAGCNSKNEVVQ